MSGFFASNLDELEKKEFSRGVWLHAFGGRSLSFARVEFEPGVAATRHSHESEQGGLVLAGTLTIEAGGRVETLREGNVYLLQSGVTHLFGAGPEGALIVEAFSPPRDNAQKVL